MFFQNLLLVVSLTGFLTDFHISCCDEDCADKPVFTPSRLVVKFGDSASARCSICQHCQSDAFGVEVPQGVKTTNGTTVTWTVDSLTEFAPDVICYYDDDDTGDQCCTRLPVTVYKPPDNVTIFFAPQMFEGRQDTLQCDVSAVAPVENLAVTFYRGQTRLGQSQTQFSDTQKKPVFPIYTLTITPSKEDDGGQFWCEAKLELGPEGPQTPPVVRSESFTATVHYEDCADKPVFTPSRLVVKYGDSASARCSICQHCQSEAFGLEIPQGAATKNGTTVTWTVNRLTEFAPSVICYYNDDDTGDQCSTKLPVTVYKPPDSVSIRFNPQMFEGRPSTLECDVSDVAPVENLIVTFYRGQTALSQTQFSDTEEYPVSRFYNLTITPSKEDDGGQFWCEAKLELGPEGPQTPPVVRSERVTATVHFNYIGLIIAVVIIAAAVIVFIGVVLYIRHYRNYRMDSTT